MADGAEYGGSWSGTMFIVLGRKNTLYYQYLLQIDLGNTAKVYINQNVIAFEIICVKKAIP